MVGGEALQFVIGALLATVMWVYLTRRRSGELRRLGNDPRSDKFPVAPAAGLLALKFGPHVGKGSTIFLPVAKGLYPRRVGIRKGEAWKNTLSTWMERGATIHLIVTLPNGRAQNLWWPLARRWPETFRIRFLHRELATNAEDRADIERLDTFHPILLVNSSGDSQPGAMWIEGDHPVDSIFAYKVEYVAPSDAMHDARFNEYRHMYERLLQGAHVKTLSVRHEDGTRKVA